MIKLFITILFIFILGAIGYGAKMYYDDTQAQIQRMATENATLNVAMQQQQASMEAMRLAAEKQQALNAELQANLLEANAGLNEIRQKLANHDLTKLALARPGMIQTRINKGTQDAFRQFEQDTGNTSDSEFTVTE